MAREAGPYPRTHYDAGMQTRLLAIFAALIAVVALVAGCSGSSSNDSAKDLPDAATLLKESSETTRGQTSAHLKLTVQGQIADLPVESLVGDLTQTPAVAAKGTADIIFLGQRLQDVEFVVSDSDLYAAITAGGSLSNFGPASEIYDVAAILNPDVGLANLLANFSDPKAAGREKVEGAETIRITGDVSADAVNKIAPQIGATGPVPGTAWISEDGDHELMQAQLEPSPGNSVTMTLSKWGEPVTVDKPGV
ncbi:lipoarabinomannan carrier protein LprG [Mycolicibacterium cyprinidarum]|uniref:Lipoarabinomannan carrier protein LprG n=1 Tax=Mycolicibacterium cyprinidarum TaxID=2860311 RepID=A0ABQ4V833_9MYCO|nr:lipoarabinomannan carrier protein LprG [Mycolicibacterium sp. NGTWSNA01]GJF13179.1 lipoarabinomannan carrier protein LprG [Mycolicibacterium sp. NGTWS0302]GJF15631.1 lipoarabinomannan carrier protein LprG [Mycolicibacterium sp. NGTWS1803]